MGNEMTPEVEAAIEEVRAAFPGHAIDITSESQGGAYITVHDLWIGDQYEPCTTWVGFQVTFQYPRTDCYPHFLDSGVRRKENLALGEAFSGPTTWNNRPALQVSRRSNRWDPCCDTAALKLTKVLEWLRMRP